MQKNVRSIDQALRVAAEAVERNGGFQAVQVEKSWLRASIETAAVVDEGGFLIVPVVFATETPVRRYNYRYNDYEGEYFDEVLSLDSAHCDLARLNSGGPVLDSHDRHGSVRDVVLGVVVPGSAVLANGEARARLRMSAVPENASLRQNIKDGIICNISVGYEVSEFTREEAVNTNQVPVYRATNWEPQEISFVPVPADINSGVRGADSPPKNLNTIPMKYGTRAHRNAEAGANPQGGAATAPAAAPAPAPAPAPNPAPAAPATPAEPAPVAPDATTAERSRIMGIQTAVRAFGLGEEFAAPFITAGSTVDAVRAAIQNHVAANDALNGVRGVSAAVNVGAEDAKMEAFARAAEAGVIMRVQRSETGLTPEQVTAGRGFAGMSLLRLAEECLRVQGVAVPSSSRQIAQQALRAQGRAATGMLSTSDLPMLLGSIVTRTLRNAYAAAPATWEPWVNKGTLSDFRTTHRVSMTELLQEFAKVPEGGEYTYNTVSELAEAIRLAKYGTIIPLSMEAIINDDLGAFNRLPTAAARKSKNLQSDLVYNVLLNNPAMSDGNALFSAAHGNIAASGSALSVASMGAATLAFRTQKAPGEATAQLNLAPKFLIVGPELEQAAIQFLSGLYLPTKQTDINIYQGRLTPIVEGRITGKKWFLAADPAEVDTVEVDYLAGEPELFTEERWNFERDSYEHKARTIVGVAPVEYRGLYYNPGA